MTIIVTGSAGFIGYHVAKKLILNNEKVIGIDNFNDYYDPALKEARWSILEQNHNFDGFRIDISNVNNLLPLNRLPFYNYLMSYLGSLDFDRKKHSHGW